MNDELQISSELIVDRIYLIRNKIVMLSHDLAELYQVETKRLNEQVRRNLGRFPDRYMFKLSAPEYNSLRSQFATLKRRKHSKYLSSQKLSLPKRLDSSYHPMRNITIDNY